MGNSTGKSVVKLRETVEPGWTRPFNGPVHSHERGIESLTEVCLDCIDKLATMSWTSLHVCGFHLWFTVF